MTATYQDTDTTGLMGQRGSTQGKGTNNTTRIPKT